MIGTSADMSHSPCRLFSRKALLFMACPLISPRSVQAMLHDSRLQLNQTFCEDPMVDA